MERVLLQLSEQKHKEVCIAIKCQYVILKLNWEKSVKLILVKEIKGTWTRLVKFVYNFFLSQTFINQQHEAIFKQNDHVHGIELHAAFEERENKQKDAKF